MRDPRDHQPTTEREAFENAWREYWSETQDWLDGVASDYGPEFSLKLSPNYYGRMDDIDNANLTVKLLWFEHSFYIRSNAEEGESHPDFDQVEISASEDNFWNLNEENLWKLAFFELFQQQDHERVVRGANWTKPADERASCFLGPEDGICLNCQRRIRRHFGGTEYRCFPNTLAEEVELQGRRPRAVPAVSLAEIEATRSESRSDVAAACGVPVEWVPENHANMSDEQIVEAVEAKFKDPEISSTCPASDPTASETPPSS